MRRNTPRIYKNSRPKPNDPRAMVETGFNVVPRLYSSVRAIFAELGQSDTSLLKALRDGHGIEFDSVRTDPTLFFIITQHQKAALEASGVKNPTNLQLLGTSTVIALSEEEAITKYKAQMHS